jgi:hypothetical protein
MVRDDDSIRVDIAANEPTNANLPTLGGKSEAFDDLGTGQRGEHSTR